MNGNELQCRLKESPQKLYREIMGEYGGYVYAIIYNKLRSVCGTQEVDECVSDVFAEIFMKISGLSTDERDIKGYISTVAKRRAIDYFRKYSIKQSSYEELDSEQMREIASESNIEEETDKKELQKILLDKITELGEPDSEIIIRKFYYNQNSAEIAKRLSLKAVTVRSRCKRALERLGVMLADAGISM